MAEYMRQLTGRDYGLPPAKGHAPPLTHERTPWADVCDGTMTCSCALCDQERHRIAERAKQRPLQPWETRRAA